MNAPVKYRIKGTKVYVSPVNRARAETSPYHSASTAKRLANWNINTGGPNSTLNYSLPLLRERSRDTARKNGLADAGLEVLVNNIIGTGIKPQFNTKDAGLNKELAELFLAWTDESDADGRFDFYGQQALAVRSMLEAGDVFARLRTRRPEDGLKVPLQIQLLESEFCPVEKNETLPTSTIQSGVEFNFIGQRTFYWMYKEHPMDGIIRRGGTGMPDRVPASEIIHLAQVKRPGMIRGEPWLVRALLKLHDLDEFDDATLLKQKIANMFAGFVTPSAEGKFGYESEDTEDGVALAPLEPGTLQVLEPGAEMNFSEPPSTGNDYVGFMAEQNRAIEGSLGILYEQLTGDFSKVNDRTWRAAMNEFKRRLARWQHSTVVFQFCRPIMQRWVEYAVLSGAIKLPKGIDVAAVARPKWLPQAHAYINPVQDIQAKRDEIRAGLKSRAETVSESGGDVEALDAEIAADNKRADDLELLFDSDGRTDLKGGTPGDVEEPEAPDTEDDDFRKVIKSSLMSGLTDNG